MQFFWAIRANKSLLFSRLSCRNQLTTAETPVACCVAVVSILRLSRLSFPVALCPMRPRAFICCQSSRFLATAAAVGARSTVHTVIVADCASPQFTWMAMGEPGRCRLAATASWLAAHFPLSPRPPLPSPFPLFAGAEYSHRTSGTQASLHTPASECTPDPTHQPNPTAASSPQAFLGCAGMELATQRTVLEQALSPAGAAAAPRWLR